MFDFAQARHFMIEGQLRTNDVTQPGIVRTMSQLAREDFVPAPWRTLAYTDREIPAAEAGQPGAARLLPSPMVLGKLLRIADIQPGDSVLHVGCTTGYGTAVISYLAGSVVALEEDESLAKAAAANLARAGVDNVAVVNGPLTVGYPEGAPYDVILIEGAVEVLPPHFADQLKDNGRLIAIEGAGRTGQGGIFRRSGKGLSGFPMFDAAAPLLPGFQKVPAFAF